MKSAGSSPEAVDKYIAGFPDDVRKILEQVRATIKRVAPDAGEAIKYGMPTLLLNGNLVHFAAHERHIGFYPTPSAIAAFKSELSQYKGAKGSVLFPMDRPMPLSLIEKIVKLRVEEARAKLKAKKKAR
ncbi:MAG TPA: DUF1801 domain-containing protein [Acidobacteriota bacterium]|nr:DUF1801 domain-containing protein [Acidobacteriota bacterium]